MSSPDLMTMAMCESQVIDLDKYGLSEIISSLFAEDGGSYEGDRFLELWEDMETTRPIIIKLNVPSMGAVITSSDITRTDTVNGSKGFVTVFRVLMHGYFVYLTAGIYDDAGMGGVVVKVTNDLPT